ncbi:hypothetical protein RRG08_017056 [Elysia crispata]|uniref:Uncharacterized protein n=1 Tax=Elysia crispata TaxID=231223 RepID=A0AAE0Z963_9GAST|nr:hypothetical protein RRG08_017056 [Elysia crispata]
MQPALPLGFNGVYCIPMANAYDGWCLGNSLTDGWNVFKLLHIPRHPGESNMERITINNWSLPFKRKHRCPIPNRGFSSSGHDESLPASILAASIHVGFIRVPVENPY